MIQLSNNRIKYKIPHLRLPNSHFIPCWIPIFKRHLVVLQVPRGQEHPKETHWNYVQNGNWKHMKQHKNTCVIIYIYLFFSVYIYNYNYIYICHAKIYKVYMIIWNTVILPADMFFSAGKTISAAVPAGFLFLCRGALPASWVSLTFFSSRRLVELFLGEQVG